MKFEFSAGGVVYKKEKDLMILVSQHSQHHGWVFPKGLIGDKEENNPSTSSEQRKETKEEAAIREVKEETGADGEILQALTPVTYWYVWQEEKRKKTVYYFIMKFISGDVTQHDHEMEAVEWIKAEEVENKLSFPADKKVWREARKLLEET